MRLIPGDPDNARLGLRTIEADLNAGGAKGVKGLVVQDHVTEGIQQAAGEILQAAEQLQGCPSELGRAGVRLCSWFLRAVLETKNKVLHLALGTPRDRRENGLERWWIMRR